MFKTFVRKPREKSKYRLKIGRLISKSAFILEITSRDLLGILNRQYVFHLFNKKILNQMKEEKEKRKEKEREREEEGWKRKEEVSGCNKR